MKTYSVKRKESQQLYLHSQALETIQTFINRIRDNQLYYILSKNYASAIKRNKLLVTKINIKTSHLAKEANYRILMPYDSGDRNQESNCSRCGWVTMDWKRHGVTEMFCMLF